MLTVFFHNLKGFDSHIIMTYIYRNFAPSNIQIIPTTSEKYISFQIGSLRFLDSLQFLNASLDSLVQSLAKDGVDKFQQIQRHFIGSDLVFQKDIYFYEYMDSRHKFDETKLPPTGQFYSHLKEDCTSEDNYAHAQNVWNELNLQNLRQYHDLYLTLDVLLLADVFENFRRMSLDYYE